MSDTGTFASNIKYIVNKDQVGYIKDRFIGDNIRTMLDVLEITEHIFDPGLLVLVDFNKSI